MPLPIVHHPDYDALFNPGHRFPMGKYSALIARIRALRLDGDLRQPELLPADTLKLAHASDYVDQVIACAVPAPIEREIGFPVTERVSRRAQLATAGTLLAARIALESGIACNSAGGSHHARHEHGAGFCTLNDVAVASLALLGEGAVRQILIVDLDVHQGDGTARILAEEPRAFTFSMHAAKNYPVRKAVSDLDVELEDGLGDEAYLATLEVHLPGLLDRVAPELVFYNAGVDPHCDDRLGRLSLGDEGLRARDRTLIQACRGRGIAFCGVVGGGYSTDVETLAARHAILFETAAEFV